MQIALTPSSFQQDLIPPISASIGLLAFSFYTAPAFPFGYEFQLGELELARTPLFGALIKWISLPGLKVQKSPFFLFIENQSSESTHLLIRILFPLGAEMTTSTIPSKSLVVLSPSSSSASANIERLLCPENGLFRAILHILRQFSYLHQQESIHSLLSLLGFRESKETSTVLAVVGTVQESTVALSEGGIRLGCHCSRRGSVTGTN